MKRIHCAAALAAAIIAVTPVSVFADGHEAEINAYVESHIRGWLGSEEIIGAVDFIADWFCVVRFAARATPALALLLTQIFANDRRFSPMHWLRMMASRVVKNP